MRPVASLKAAAQKVAQKAAVAAPALLAAAQAHPAFALVDDRLNGDGTGLTFGINEYVCICVAGGGSRCRGPFFLVPSASPVQAMRPRQRVPPAL